MRRIRLAFGLALSLCTAACGGVKPTNPDAPPGTTDAMIDGGDTPIDAAVDAPVDASPLVSPQGQEVTTGGGRMTGPTFTMDVQLGHPTGQQQIQGNTLRFEGNTPVKP